MKGGIQVVRIEGAKIHEEIPLFVGLHQRSRQ